MDGELLKTAGAVAGIAGIPLLVFFYLFRDYIAKFTLEPFNLSPDQGFRLLRLVAILIWSIPIVGLALYAYGQYLKVAPANAASAMLPERADRTACVAQQLNYNSIMPTNDQRECLDNKVIALTWSNDLPNDKNFGSFLIRHSAFYETLKLDLDPMSWGEVYIPTEKPRSTGSFYQNFEWKLNSEHASADFHAGSCANGLSEDQAASTLPFEKRIGFTLVSAEPRPGNPQLTYTEWQHCNSIDYKTAGSEKCGWVRLELFIPSAQPKSFCNGHAPLANSGRTPIMNEVSGGVPLCVRNVGLDGTVISRRDSITWSRMGTIRAAWCD